MCPTLCTALLLLARVGVAPADDSLAIRPPPLAGWFSEDPSFFDVRRADPELRRRILDWRQGERYDARLAGEAELVQQVPGAKVDRDDLWGLPIYVRSLWAPLIGSAGGGGGRDDPNDLLGLIYEFVDAHADLLGIGSGDLRKARLIKLQRTPVSGRWHIWWQQQVQRSDLYECHLRAVVTADRGLASLSCRMLPTPAFYVANLVSRSNVRAGVHRERGGISRT